MVPYIESALEIRMIMGICGVIHIMATIFISAYGILLRLNKRKTLISVFTALVGIALFQGISDVECVCQYGYSPSILATIVGRIPYIGIAFIMVLLLIDEFVLYISLRRCRRESVTAETIKESLDVLPEGVCFAAGNGTPILVNKTMNEICTDILKKEALNINWFWNSLQQYNINKGENPQVCEIRTGDDKVWIFKKKKIQVDENDIQEIVAYNVTEQHRLKCEIEKNNNVLKQINNKLHFINDDIEEITREKEILATKVRVHDDIGRSLLMVRLNIERNGGEKERKEILMFWNTIVDVLNYESVDKYEYDWELIMKNAKDLGVTIIINVDMPDNITHKRILIVIARECLTNLVKHAGGNKMYINIKQSMKELEICVSNNGEIPKEKIVEKGGLLNLKRLVELEEGKMIVECIPQFSLKVILTKKGGCYAENKSNDCR